MSGGGRPREGWLTIGESSADIGGPRPGRAAAVGAGGTMTAMSQPTETPEPDARPEGADPGRRDRPGTRPADERRDRRGGASSALRASGSPAPRSPPTGRGLGRQPRPERSQMGILGAVVGIAVFLILAIGFSFSAGLLIVAIFTGRFIGLFVRAGAAGTLSSPARVARLGRDLPRGARRWRSS